jgi:hypothetical protein
MARLQILELPEGANDERRPFLLIIDQVEPTLDPLGIEGPPSLPINLAEKIGARTVLVFEETVEIPANEIMVSPDGYPLTIRVEGDFDQFRQQVQDEATAASRVLASARYATDQHPEQPAKHSYNNGEGPSLRHRLDFETAQRRSFVARLADALGMDPLRDWDDIVNAARGLRRDRDDQHAAVEAVRELHRKANNGETCVYCAHGQRVGYDTTWPCDTIRALDVRLEAAQPEPGNG